MQGYEAQKPGFRRGRRIRAFQLSRQRIPSPDLELSPVLLLRYRHQRSRLSLHARLPTSTKETSSLTPSLTSRNRSHPAYLRHLRPSILFMNVSKISPHSTDPYPYPCSCSTTSWSTSSTSSTSSRRSPITSTPSLSSTRSLTFRPHRNQLRPGWHQHRVSLVRSNR